MSSRIHFSLLAAAILFMFVARYAAYPATLEDADSIEELGKEDEKREKDKVEEAALKAVPEKEKSTLEKILDGIKKVYHMASFAGGPIKDLILFIANLKKDLGKREYEDELRFK